MDQVRRFNRLVAERIGALEDAYLSRARPLGQARLLWEIGPSGCDVRSLRVRLGLDSGYLSRLLRALEGDGMVSVGASGADRRVRTVRLTRRGLAEREELDRRSDTVARSILGPLAGAQRDRLLRAMAEVERLLAASMVEIAPRRPDDPSAIGCLERYVEELSGRLTSGFEPALARPLTPADLVPPAGVLLVATLRGEALGCGALRFHPGQPAEIKRMWVAPSVRGLGVGRRLLEDLECRAGDGGAEHVQLDTNRALVEAIALYRSAGYRQVAPFNDERYADLWFEKALGASDQDGMVGPVSQSAGSARLRSPSGPRRGTPGGTGAGGQSGG